MATIARRFRQIAKALFVQPVRDGVPVGRFEAVLIGDRVDLDQAVEGALLRRAAVRRLPGSELGNLLPGGIGRGGDPLPAFGRVASERFAAGRGLFRERFAAFNT